MKKKKYNLLTHSLTVLYGKINSYISLDFDKTTLILLDDLYIDARYPGDMGLLPDGKPTITEALSFYEIASNINKTIKNILSRL